MDLNVFVEYSKLVRPAEACQAFYMLASTVILGIDLLPRDLRSALMDYGARQKEPSQREEEKGKNALAYFMSFTEVPHSWFLHFYVLSVACSAFWAMQFLTRGRIMETVAQAQLRGGETSMEIEQVYVAWTLMALQGTRRLYESMFVTRPGSSPMSSIHWALGLAYYATMGVSVWVEGSGKSIQVRRINIDRERGVTNKARFILAAIVKSWEGIESRGQLSFHVVLGIALYLLGCFKQNACHAHLASLKKYTLPEQGWFKYIVCPHYTGECLIYLGISLASAPTGQICNQTVFFGLVFIMVNLGSTAAGTKQWYAQKFGADKVAKKWRMIPFIF